MKLKIGLLTLATILSLVSTAIVADDEVCYVPIRGEGLTSCTPEFDAEGNILDLCPKTVGLYKLVLKKSTNGPGRKTLRLSGPLFANINPNGTLNHILVDEDMEGLIYTFGDTVVEPHIINLCLTQLKEVLNVTLGTGTFTGAQGTLTAIVDMDTCTGVNEFDVVRNEGEICFSADEADKGYDD